MAFKAANGYAELKVDTALIAEMTRVIADNAIDVVMFDPLVTLHSVNESDNGRMDVVIRIFAKLADACGCSVDISHHTRKLAAGSFDHTVDDARGASSVRDAVRMLRILNIMSHSGRVASLAMATTRARRPPASTSRRSTRPRALQTGTEKNGEPPRVVLKPFVPIDPKSLPRRPLSPFASSTLSNLRQVAVPSLARLTLAARAAVSLANKAGA
jgi:AAA domain